jgi:hypothetical protein
MSDRGATPLVSTRVLPAGAISNRQPYVAFGARRNVGEALSHPRVGAGNFAAGAAMVYSSFQIAHE